MDFKKGLIIGYHPANSEEVITISENLSIAGYEIQHLKWRKEMEAGTFAESLKKGNLPSILLISQNLLREEACLNGLLQAARHIRDAQGLIPIVADGHIREGEKQEFTAVKTDISSVGSVLRHINYWQDKYLDLRRDRTDKETKYQEDDDFEPRLKRIRLLSTEIGELFKTIKEIGYIEYEQLIGNKFEAFFRKVQDNQGFEKYLLNLAEEAELEILEDPQKEQEGPEYPEKVGSDSDAEEFIEKEEQMTEEISEETEKPSGDPDVSEAGDKEEEKFEEEQEVGAIEELETETDPTEDEIVESVSESELRRIFKLVNSGVPLAAIALQKSLREHPNNPDLLVQQAILYIRQKKYKKARRTLQTILETSPERSDVLFLLGEISQFYEEDPSKAIKYYKKVIKLDPGFPEANFRMGLLSFEKKKYKKAAAFFKKVLRSASDHLPARYYYGSLLGYQLGKRKKAIKQLKKVVASDPQHPFACYDLAVLYHAKGEYKKARRYYDQACKNNPELKTYENDAAFSAFEDWEAEAMPAEKVASRRQELAGPRMQKPYQSSTKQQKMGRKPNTKLAMITGATSGIGKATAHIFASEGFNLILTGRREERLKDICEDLKEEFGTEVMGLQFDVRDMDQVQNELENLPEGWNEIDVLVNNAGLAKGLAPIQESKIGHWEEMIDTNIKGLLYVTRMIVPGMVERGGGQIINVCSTAGKEAYPKGNVYCATKHAVDALTKAMRLDLHQHHIRVGQVSPGHVEETEFALVRFDGDEDKAKIYDDFNPLTSRDVAEAILFMVSRPSHVNIQDILLMGTQQANSFLIDRSGRNPEENHSES